jgi:hypothetical protein
VSESRPSDLGKVAERGFLGKLPEVNLRGVLVGWLLDFAAIVLFPRMRRRTRRWMKRSPVRIALLVLRRALLLFATDAFFRGLARQGLEADMLRGRMGEELGRRPTEDEFMERWMKVQGYEPPE